MPLGIKKQFYNASTFHVFNAFYKKNYNILTHSLMTVLHDALYQAELIRQSP